MSPSLEGVTLHRRNPVGPSNANPPGAPELAAPLWRLRAPSCYGWAATDAALVVWGCLQCDYL